mgnify:CR=1 FL=1
MSLVPFNRNKSITPHDAMMNMLDDFFSDTWLPSRSLSFDTFKIDVKENESEYTVEAELPGIAKDEINLDLHDGRLTISVARSEQTENKKENYIHQERRVTSMQRSIYLADASDDGVKAALHDGVLTITVKKTAKQKGVKRIEIE